MPSKPIVPENMIHTNVESAVRGVFKTMMGEVVSPKSLAGILPGTEAVAVGMAGETPTKVAAPHQEGPCIVGMVGFVGNINGFIYIYLDVPFAVHCTAKMLGMDPLELGINGDDTVNDAVGELTNMIVGNFKNALCDVGFPCKLTIPSILRARSFSIKSVKATRRFVYAFDCRGNQLVTDVLMHED